MRKKLNKINHNNISIKEPQTFLGKVFPRLSYNNKLISLPIINKTLCFTERNALNNNNKKALEGFKPKEDKKIRNKIVAKDINNKLNIKYLSLTNRKDNDNILFLLKKIKMNNTHIKFRNDLMTDDLFSNDSINKTNFILLNKDYNDFINDKKYQKIKNKTKKIDNFSQIKKRINTIYINAPNLINKKININTEIIDNQHMKTESNINEEEDRRKLIIHNIFFEWVMSNIKYLNKICNEGNKLNHSYDSSMNSLKNINKQINLKKRDYKKIKSASFSNYNNRFTLNENKNNHLKNKIINQLIDKIKFINEDNINLRYLSPKILKNLLNTVSKQINLNKKYTKSNSIIGNNEKNNTDSEEFNLNKKKILSLIKYNNFLAQFMLKLFLKNTKYNEETNFQENLTPKKTKDKVNEPFPFKRYIKKNIEKRNNDNNDNEYKTNKSIKIKKKINVTNLFEKIKFKKDLDKNNIQDEVYSNSENSNHKVNEDYKISKKYYNVVLISSPENITKDRKTMIESYYSKKQNNNNTLKNQKEIVKNNDNNIEINKSMKTNIKTYFEKLNKNYFKDSSTRKDINEHSTNFHPNYNSTSNNNTISKNKNKNILFNSKREDISRNTLMKDNKNKNNNSILNKSIENDIKKNIDLKPIKSSKNQTKNRDISEFLDLNDSKKNEIENKNSLKNNDNNNKTNNLNHKITKFKVNKTDNNIDIKENKNEGNTIEDVYNRKSINKTSKMLDTSKEDKRKTSNNTYENKDEIENKPTDSENNYKFSPLRKKDKENTKSVKNNLSSNKTFLIERKDQEIKNKMRSIIKITSPKKTKKKKNIDENNIMNNDIYYIKQDKKQKSDLNDSINDKSKISSDEKKIIKEKEEKERNIVTNPNNDSNENYTLTNPSLNKYHLDNILINRNSKSNSKTFKKIINKLPKEDDEEEKLDFDFIKITKKKRKSLKPLNSLINYLKNNEEVFDKKDQLNISFGNFLSEEDVQNLITYSKKLKKLASLKDKEKTEEIIQIEKEIKQSYNEILTKYLINQKYKDLLKEKKFVKKKKLKILQEENNEEDNDEESEYQFNKKERKKSDDNYAKIKIEESEEEKENRKIPIFSEEKEEKPKKEKKELIYDNTYLFKKKKKDKNIPIKKEVLDILQNKNNFSPKKGNKGTFETYNGNIIVRLSKRRSRKINYKFLQKIKINKNRINKNQLSLFSHDKGEKTEKLDTEEEKEDKEKLLDKKIKLFFEKIQRIKRNEGDYELIDFLINEEISKNDNINRLLYFANNISNIQNKDKCNKSKLKFFSPVEFKTQNL